jgi:prepilin-type N-terminal cleavage/methylation domain-containing protein/prepilin-type processing-associated H-X9-DG protein
MSTPAATNRHDPRGFTLVELLVVIGIIALLISLLLPALNRARAHANLIDCQARMRQMGQAVMMYATQYGGVLPASNGNNTTHGPLPPEAGGSSSYRWMPTTLTRVLGHKGAQENWGFWHPIFTDKDAIEYNAAGYEFQRGNRNHYNFNMRLFVDPTLNDPALTPARPTKYRRLSSIKRSAEVVAIYDGTPFQSWGGNAYHLGDGLRSVSYNFLWYATAGMVHGNNWIRYHERITRSGNQGHVDWRHGPKRDTANVMFLDGHVESRKFDARKGSGDLTVKDFVTNRPTN